MAAYRKYTYFVLIFVFIVVLAGSIVRTTHSGMGCPDWPKCFGTWIPPVSADQLPVDFEKYLAKQDIDHTFNAFHTWIEYLNRLLGALLGVLIFIHFIWSLRMRKSIGKVALMLSVGLLVLVGFTGWLGKLVVNENLAVVKISLHMLSAMTLIILPILILNITRKKDVVFNRQHVFLYGALFSVLLIQMALGIWVRQEVDIISKNAGYLGRENWLNGIDFMFTVHRSFSWLIFLVAVYIFYNAKESSLVKYSRLVLCLVLTMFGIGIIFSYGDFPRYAQPMHLVVALVFLGVVVNVLHVFWLNRDRMLIT